jgi:hypothetical protein
MPATFAVVSAIECPPRQIPGLLVEPTVQQHECVDRLDGNIGDGFGPAAEHGQEQVLTVHEHGMRGGSYIELAGVNVAQPAPRQPPYKPFLIERPQAVRSRTITTSEGQEVATVDQVVGLFGNGSPAARNGRITPSPIREARQTARSAAAGDTSSPGQIGLNITVAQSPSRSVSVNSQAAANVGEVDFPLASGWVMSLQGDACTTLHEPRTTRASRVPA